MTFGFHDLGPPYRVIARRRLEAGGLKQDKQNYFVSIIRVIARRRLEAGGLQRDLSKNSLRKHNQSYCEAEPQAW